MPVFECRLLTLQDAQDFHALRLRAVQEAPEAFLESYEDLSVMPPSSLIRQFDNGWIAGAFLGQELCAVCGLYRHRTEKARHKGTLWGVYVAPEHRGHGLARQLIQLLLTQAKAACIELVHLSTDAANARTIALYEQLGFQVYGIEKHVLKLPTRYVDDVLMVLFINQ